MEATRKRKQSHCVHTAEDGTQCGKTIQHWTDKLCRNHFNIRNGVISRTPQRRNTRARNDAPTNDNGLLQSHSLRRHPIQEEKEEEEEKNGEDEEDEEEEGGAISSPSTTGAIACHRDFMTSTTTTMMMTNTDTVLPSLEVNNVRQAQADQECQQQMSTTTTMTAIVMAAPTPLVPPPTVIQPILPLTLNDNLPCNINVPTSSHLQREFQVRDGRINALEIELQGRINALEREVQQMSAQLNIFQEQMNRTTVTRPTEVELAFRDGCTGSPFDFSLNTTLERHMNDEIMDQRRDNERQRCPAGTNEELRTNTPRRRTARKHPGIIDENNLEQPRVLEQETLQRSTAQEEPERREEVAGIQYYRNFSNQRSNRHRIANDDGRNAGLVNNNVLCYANAIFQIIASCGCLNESLSNPPNMAHQHFSLYYNFASVISSMISGGNEAVNPNNFTNVFSERVPQFENEQRKYLLYQMYRL